MSVNAVEGAYEGALRAFRNPMLGLLHGTYAPFVVTMLALLFPAQRPQVGVSDAHAELDAALARLRAAGYGTSDSPLPAGTARDICRGWVAQGWLKRQVLESTEVYQVSANGVRALEIAGWVGGTAPRVSESRVRTLLDAVEHLAQDADPDVMTRLARLDAEIRERQAELARLERTGALEPVDDVQLVEEAENVLHLARGLPSDFARVVESIRQVQRDVITDLRQDVRPTGEVLREYLDRGKDLMESTPEGRAFSGALALIGRAEHIDELAGSLRTILSHGFVRQLSEHQQRELFEISRRIQQGVRDVLEAQRQASHVIGAQVRNHDPLRDREVDDLLRDVMLGFQQWMPTSRHKQVVPPARRLPVARVAHLRMKTDDLQPPSPPEPLVEWGHEDLPEDGSRAWGGPQYRELEDHLSTLVEQGGSVSLGTAFDAAPHELRRPVDLLGLLELVHRLGMDGAGQVAVAETVRPDGSRRRFAFEDVRVTTSDKGE